MTHPEPRHKLTVKVGDALRTIQGYTMEEFQMARAEAFDDLAEDLELVMKAKAVGNAGPLVNTAAPAPAPASGDVWASPPPSTAYPATPAPSCSHGVRIARKGMGAKGEWRGWMCPTPKGTPDQCSPDWVQKGTPGWNNFPV